MGLSVFANRGLVMHVVSGAAQGSRSVLKAPVTFTSGSRRQALLQSNAFKLPGTSRPFRARATWVVKAQAVIATEAEQKANLERWRESGNSTGSSDEWHWTLNWDPITDAISVGSCPRSPDDVDRIVDEGDIDAIVCLQCDDCLNHLQVDLNAIRQRAADRGVTHVQVAIRDFDRADQARMLPEAARMIGLLRRLGHRVYVHCTAGINRAPLAVAGYLTFVEGMPVNDALSFVKARRGRANPYAECLKDARTQLLVAETKHVLQIAEDLYKVRKKDHMPEDGFADWMAAENLALKMLFERQLSASASLLASVQRRHNNTVNACREELEQSTNKVLALRKSLQAKQAQLEGTQQRMLDSQQRMLDSQQQMLDITQQLEELKVRCAPLLFGGAASIGEEQVGCSKDEQILALRRVVASMLQTSRDALNSQ